MEYAEVHVISDLKKIISVISETIFLSRENKVIIRKVTNFFLNGKYCKKYKNK